MGTPILTTVQLIDEKARLLGSAPFLVTVAPERDVVRSLSFAQTRKATELLAWRYAELPLKCPLFLLNQVCLAVQYLAG
jgi:hypothetical protein